MKLQFQSTHRETWMIPESKAWCAYCELIDARDNVDVTEVTFQPKTFVYVATREELEDDTQV